MNRNTKVAAGAVLVAVAGGAAWLGIHKLIAAEAVKAAPAASPEEAKPVAAVTTVELRAGSVSQSITAFGSVTAEPGAVVVLSMGVECRVRHLRVAGGQGVDQGTAVIEVEPSPDARFQSLDSRNALEAARKDAEAARQRFDLKLATNADVRTADRVVQAAEAKSDDLHRRGADEESRTIKADFAAMVGKVDVQEGQLVPAGGPLVELVPRGRIEVRLGVEPKDAPFLRGDQPVELFPATGDDEEPIDGRVRLVTRRVSPDSRLVDVFVVPSERDPLLLDSFVRGKLVLHTVSGLVVPRDALLPDDQGFVLFTVKAGRAVKHSVKVVLQNEKDAVVTGEGLNVGDAVALAGSLELDDGTAVTVTAPTTAASTAPAAEDDK